MDGDPDVMLGLAWWLRIKALIMLQCPAKRILLFILCLQIDIFVLTLNIWNKTLYEDVSPAFNWPTSHHALPFLCEHPHFFYTSLLSLSVWTGESSCTVLNSSVVAEVNCSYSCGSECRKSSRYPCLQVYVSLNSTGRVLKLSHNEEVHEANPEVHHTWPDHMHYTIFYTLYPITCQWRWQLSVKLLSFIPNSWVSGTGENKCAFSTSSVLPCRFAIFE